MKPLNIIIILIFLSASVSIASASPIDDIIQAATNALKNLHLLSVSHPFTICAYDSITGNPVPIQSADLEVRPNPMVISDNCAYLQIYSGYNVPIYLTAVGYNDYSTTFNTGASSLTAYMIKIIIPTPTPNYNCIDNTSNLACSSQKPLYCYYSTLINKASTCGCPSGQTPSGDNCITVTPTPTPAITPLSTPQYQCYDGSWVNNISLCTTPTQTTPVITPSDNNGETTNFIILSGIIMITLIGILLYGKKR